MTYPILNSHNRASPSHSYTSFHHPSLSFLLIFFFTYVVPSSPRIPPSRYDLASPPYTNSTHFYLLSASIFLPSFLPSWPAWTYCPARRSHSFCPRFPFSLSLPLFLPHLFSPSTPAFPLRFPSPLPLLSLKVFAQSGLAQRGSTFCRYHPKWLPAAMSDASCCASPLLFRHHCALLLWATYDSGAAYVGGCCGSLCTLLSLGTLLTTSGLVFPITSSLLFSLVPVFRLSLPLISRGGLCGTSLWHIVRPVLQCPSPPLWYLAWVLSSPSSDPFTTASSFSLSRANEVSLCYL